MLKEKEDKIRELHSIIEEQENSIVTKDNLIGTLHSKIKTLEEINKLKKPVTIRMSKEAEFKARDYKIKDAKERWKKNSIYILVDGIDLIKDKEGRHVYNIPFRELKVDPKLINIIENK